MSDPLPTGPLPAGSISTGSPTSGPLSAGSMSTDPLPSVPLPTAAPEAVGLSAAALARLTGVLRQRAADGRLPGGVALVARHGKVAYHEAFGVLDPATGTPMTRDAIFRIYSMTKAIVSVAVMMLWEEGRLLLSDPIGQYLPALANPQVGVVESGEMHTIAANRPITVQDLLRHTSGLT